MPRVERLENHELLSEGPERETGQGQELARERTAWVTPNGSPLFPQARAFVAFICPEVFSLSMSLPSSSLGAESYHPSRLGPQGPPSKSLILPCPHRGHPPLAVLCVLPRPPSSCRSANSGLLETRCVISGHHVLCFNRCRSNRQGRGALRADKSSV